MRVAPSPVFNLLLAPASGIVAILLFAPFLQQPMPVGGVFAGIPVVVIPVLAVVVAPRLLSSVVAIMIAVVKCLQSHRCDQRRAQQKRSQIAGNTLHVLLL